MFKKFFVLALLGFALVAAFPQEQPKQDDQVMAFISGFKTQVNNLYEEGKKKLVDSKIVSEEDIKNIKDNIETLGKKVEELTSQGKAKLEEVRPQLEKNFSDVKAQIETYVAKLTEKPATTK